MKKFRYREMKVQELRDALLDLATMRYPLETSVTHFGFDPFKVSVTFTMKPRYFGQYSSFENRAPAIRFNIDFLGSVGKLNRKQLISSIKLFLKEFESEYQVWWADSEAADKLLEAFDPFNQPPTFTCNNGRFILPATTKTAQETQHEE